MEECLLEYNIDMQSYVSSQRVVSNCNEIGFINQGTSTVVINSAIVLAPQGSWSNNGNMKETDRTPYTLTFQGDPATTTNYCVVTRKLYLRMEIK
jgi:hypothetical protein